MRGGGDAAHGYDAAYAPVSFKRTCSRFLHLEDLATGAALGAEKVGQSNMSPSDAEATLILADLRIGGGSNAAELSKLVEYLRRHGPRFDQIVFPSPTLGELMGQAEVVRSGL